MRSTFFSPSPNSLQYSLDYSKLDLQRFLPGAVIYNRNKFHLISDPFRKPLLAVQGLFAPIGTLVDKLLVGALRLRLLSKPLEQLKTENVQEDLRTYLQRQGFSDGFISAFFRPFYQGIYLAPLDEQSASMFAFVFTMFARRPVSLPRHGMQCIPDQLAATAEAGGAIIKLRHRVMQVDSAERTVTVQNLETGVCATHTCKSIIVATEGPEAGQLLSGGDVDTDIDIDIKSRGTLNVYFTKKGSPPKQVPQFPALVLNGDGDIDEGPVNNMFFPSVVSADYAPKGFTLVSATVVTDNDKARSNKSMLTMPDADVEQSVRAHLAQWFGNEEVDSWDFLRCYRIAHAQTPQAPAFEFARATRIADGVFVCGDHRRTPTLDGAVEAGVDAAKSVAIYLGGL